MFLLFGCFLFRGCCELFCFVVAAPAPEWTLNHHEKTGGSRSNKRDYLLQHRPLGEYRLVCLERTSGKSKCEDVRRIITGLDCGRFPYGTKNQNLTKNLTRAAWPICGSCRVGRRLLCGGEFLHLKPHTVHEPRQGLLYEFNIIFVLEDDPQGRLDHFRV